jgi:hypothetical protein
VPKEQQYPGGEAALVAAVNNALAAAHLGVVYGPGYVGSKHALVVVGGGYLASRAALVAALKPLDAYITPARGVDGRETVAAARAAVDAGGGTDAQRAMVDALDDSNARNAMLARAAKAANHHRAPPAVNHTAVLEAMLANQRLQLAGSSRGAFLASLTPFQRDAVLTREAKEAAAAQPQAAR